MDGRAVLRVERCEELVLESREDLAQAGKLLLTGGGDAHHVAPAVLGVSLAQDEPPLLERVENGDEATGVEPEHVGERGLCLAYALGEKREDAVVVELEAGRFDSCHRSRLEPEAEP